MDVLHAITDHTPTNDASGGVILFLKDSTDYIFMWTVKVHNVTIKVC